MELQHYLLYLRPRRPDFSITMSDEERQIMQQHVGYWMELMQRGRVVAFGPVSDPAGVYGVGIVAAENEDAIKEFIKNDPAAAINNYEFFPMRAVLPKS